MKNLILALVFVILMVGAAMAVTSTRSANVGVVGVPAVTGGAVEKKDCQSACSMKKEKVAMQGQCSKSAGEKKVCPTSGKAL